MKKLSLWIVLVMLGQWTALAQSTKLSPQAEIRVMTLGPFQPELYSVFGHSAFRILDPVHKIDKVFNYGVFDFDQPNFYLNFFKGTPYYRLGVTNYDRFKRAYISYDRSIHEQVLNLDQQERQKVYNYLVNNYKPANRNYVYNYFSDNCATKIRDVMEASLGKKSITWNHSYVDGSSIRSLMNDRMALQPWGHLAFNLFLAGIDQPAKPKQYLYLPAFVQSAFGEAIIIGKDQSRKPLVKYEEQVYVSQGIVDFDPPTMTPTVVFVIILLLSIIITVWDIVRKRRARFFDMSLFMVVGIIGCLLFYLWFFSNHTSQYNWNVMWAWPSHLFLVWGITKQKLSEGMQKYMLVGAIVSAIFIASKWFLPAYIPTYFLFLVGALLVRQLFLAFGRWG